METKFPMTLTGLKLKKAKLDKDGMEVEPAKIVVQLETPVESMAVAKLSRMFEQEGECRLETWQSELPFIKPAERIRTTITDSRTGEIVAEG